MLTNISPYNVTRLQWLNKHHIMHMVSWNLAHIGSNIRAGGLTTSSFSQCYLINMAFWHMPKVNFTRRAPGIIPWHENILVPLYAFPWVRASKLNQQIFICIKINPHLPGVYESNQTLDISKPQCWPCQENNRMYLTQLTPEGCGCYRKLVIFISHISQLLSRIDIFSISWYCHPLNTTRSFVWNFKG